MEDLDIYEEIGTSKSNQETNEAIRKLLSEEVKISGIERKSMDIDKPTFLTAAAIILGNASRLGAETPYERVIDVLKKVEEIGYPLKQFRDMGKKECLHYFGDFKSEIISKIGEY